MLGKAPEVPIGVAKQWTQPNSRAAVYPVVSSTKRAHYGGHAR
jgi:hypothetical protein